MAAMTQSTAVFQVTFPHPSTAAGLFIEAQFMGCSEMSTSAMLHGLFGLGVTGAVLHFCYQAGCTEVMASRTVATSQQLLKDSELRR